MILFTHLQNLRQNPGVARKAADLLLGSHTDTHGLDKPSLGDDENTAEKCPLRAARRASLKI